MNIPVQVEVGADMLRADSAAELATQVAAAVARGLEFMAAEVAANGLHPHPVVHEPTVLWTGSGLGAVSAADRAKADARLRQAVRKASAAFVAASAHPSGAIKTTNQDLQIERFEFETTFGLILAQLDEFPENHASDMRLRFSDQWSQLVHGVVWVATVLRPMSWARIHGEINAERHHSFDDGSLFGYFWDSARTESLRQVDLKHLHGLPSLSDADLPKPAALSKLPVGTRVVFVAAKLPEIAPGTYFELGHAFTIQIPFQEALIGALGVLDADLLLQLYSIDEQSLLGLLQLYADVDVDVWVLPFAIGTPIYGETLRANLLDHAYAKHRRAAQLGQLRPIGATARATLPRSVTGPILALPHGNAVTPDHVSLTATWQSSWIGAYLMPLIDDDEIRYRAGYARQWRDFEAEAVEVTRILALSNGILSAERMNAIWEWTAKWQTRRPEAFDLVLYAVDKRGLLDQLFDAWLEEKLYGSRLRMLIALCLRTRYARHAKVLRIIAAIERSGRTEVKHTYDVDQQRIGLFGDLWITAAGANRDPAAGVVAETRSYYSKSAKIKKLNKQALALLAGPVAEKAGPVMTQMICGGNDSTTSDDVMAQATREALKEFNFGEAFYEPTTLRLSLRVLRLERKPNAGVTDIVIHWVPVQQFEGEAWTTSGKVMTGSPIAFEAALTDYHVDHLLNQVVAPIVIVGAILLTGGAALAAGASIGGIVVAILFSELLYVFSSWQEGLTLNGFLMAAWMGEIELLGFMGIARVLGFSGRILVRGANRAFNQIALRLGAEVGTEAVTVKLLRTSASKWILFALRGTVAGVEAGGAGVLGLVAQDLLQMSACNGWSSAEEYWSRFKTGFIVGAALELVVAPLLAPVLRPLIAKASTALETVQILRRSGKSFSEIAKALLNSSDEMEAALRRALPEAPAVPKLSRGFQQRLQEILRTYAREYEARAYRNLVGMLDKELTPRASRTLARMIEHTSEQQLDELLGRVAAGKNIRIVEMLDLLADLSEDELRLLLQRGGVSQLADSPALLGLLRRTNYRGWHFLDKIFDFKVADCEAYVARFANAPPQHFDSVVDILLRNRNALPRDVIADLVLKYGPLPRPQIALLDRLHAAQVNIAGFSNAGELSLPDFAHRFPSVERALGPAGVRDIYAVIDLEASGRVRGLNDWLAFVEDKKPDDLRRTLGELAEARRLAQENPGSVIKIGGDQTAPRRAKDPTARLPSFDITVEGLDGRVSRSVEVTSIDDPVSRVGDVTPGVRHAMDKVTGRSQPADPRDFHPIPGPHDVTIRMTLAVGDNSLGGGRILRIARDGEVRVIDGDGQFRPRRGNPTNLYDDIATNLKTIPNNGLLSRVTLVDQTTHAVLAVYERVGTTWTRVR